MFGTSLKTYKVYEWPGSAPDQQFGHDIRRITPENAADVKEFRQPRLHEVFLTFLQEGRVGVFAYRNAVPIGHAWMTPGAMQPQRVNGYFHLEQGESLIHYCHVAETERGRGVYGDLLQELVRIGIESGNRRILVDTELTNTASQRGILKAGFAPIADRRVLRIGGRAIRSWQV